ncbi:hypothetical protein GN244_ATG03582 [Phytophthora infestans]|uniref:SWIM-type domain-containing protein n=1 Tax=Phytophthora infestans TaxID=4787 RepID=A0A833TP60_PHYIN|nr:hypothetical protein GN244_ATG03582 [Phytophthora infestans]
MLRAAAKASALMIAKERGIVHATEDPDICRVKQLPQGEQDADEQGVDELSTALNGPFRESSDTSESDDRDRCVGPALVVREQRARAAKLYSNVVTWSLWYAHSTAMPEEGWVVDVLKCVCGSKVYLKFKTCCHIIVARKAKRLGGPGIEAKTDKLFNRQIRKTNSTKSRNKKKTGTEIARDSATDTPLPLTEPRSGRSLLASRALDIHLLAPFAILAWSNIHSLNATLHHFIFFALVFKPFTTIELAVLDDLSLPGARFGGND